MIEIELSDKEARWLRDLMQNPLLPGKDAKFESIENEKMRKSFFETLNVGLGESHRNKTFEADIPF